MKSFRWGYWMDGGGIEYLQIKMHGVIGEKI